LAVNGLQFAVGGSQLFVLVLVVVLVLETAALGLS
jgi:hypothetical protein